MSVDPELGKYYSILFIITINTIVCLSMYLCVLLGIYKGVQHHNSLQLLELAIDLGDRLIPAFHTKTGIPFGTVNLRHGVPKGETKVI